MVKCLNCINNCLDDRNEHFITELHNNNIIELIHKILSINHLTINVYKMLFAILAKLTNPMTIDLYKKVKNS